MSSFICRQCGQAIVDTPGRGYISGCSHHPLPDYPGPTLRQLLEFSMAEFGRCPETTLVGTCTLISEYVGWNAKRIGLSIDEKMLLLFIAEAWRWRRVELVMK